MLEWAEKHHLTFSANVLSRNNLLGRHIDQRKRSTLATSFRATYTPLGTSLCTVYNTFRKRLKVLRKELDIESLRRLSNKTQKLIWSDANLTRSSEMNANCSTKPSRQSRKNNNKTKDISARRKQEQTHYIFLLQLPFLASLLSFRENE